MTKETSSLTSEDDLQFTVSKISLSFETYGFVHRKTTLKTLQVYSTVKEEFSWNTFF